MIETKYKHREAYCLMLYVSDDKTEEELIWNSRDGVTPFIIHLKSGKQAQHMQWHMDQCLPHHVLKDGERYFADMTEKRAKYLADWFIENFWNKGMNLVYENKEAAKFLLVKDYYGDGHNPTILEWGKDPNTYNSNNKDDNK